MTQSKHVFPVESRAVFGKKTKQLRSQGKVVGSVSVPNKTSLHITAHAQAFTKLVAEAGESGLVYLTLDDAKKQIPVLIEEIQYDSLTRAVTHVTFRQVSLKEAVEAEVPFEFIGEPAVKGGVLLTVLDEVTVRALPTDLPEHITVDLSTLVELGQTITLADVALDSDKVSFVLNEDQTLEDLTVVVLQEQKEEAESDGDGEQAEPEISTAKADTESAE